ncbi:hypothetical protein EYF80_004516 [Liparis tanakae]|uniref:Uncharacterized protein n=1 Tax=Liparis tanakae TaxID=230148 RepID=A0A4Z2J4Q9_9TELE|nr:hypothetical protein EYF80_004516 [Liparis tanakae]
MLGGEEEGPLISQFKCPKLLDRLQLLGTCAACLKRKGPPAMAPLGIDELTYSEDCRYSDSGKADIVYAPL